MPEGDTVLRTAQGLDRALGGDRLTRAELRWGSLGDVHLVGRTVLGCASYGKHLLLRIAPVDGAVDPGTDGSGRRFPTAPATGLTLHSHLRMDGSWRVLGAGRRPPRSAEHRVRAVLATERWTAVGFLLGMLDLVPTAEEPGLIGHLGPDILADDWTTRWRDTGRSGREEALRRLALRGADPIGEVLLDQTVTAGIGTFYMAESLFVSGISPWLPAGEVEDPGALLNTARRQLSRGAAQVVQVTTGDPRPSERSYAHARSGRPCRRCGTTVRVAPIGTPPTARPAFYCPVCQPGPTPTDDGHPIAPLGSAPHRLGSTRNQGLKPPTSGWTG